MSTVESLVGEWLPLPDVAQLLNVSITKVHALLDERALAAVRVGDRRIRSVPAAFVQDGHAVESLKGTIVVLADAGYSPQTSRCAAAPLMPSAKAVRRKSAAARRRWPGRHPL